jgi:serine-type D-Ala-D-Ala carboxypeptidase/endopeptidase (penicillin-binding protein 4)
MKLFCFIFLQITNVQQDILNLITEFKNSEATKNINVSVTIKKAGIDNELFSYNQNMAMAPASTLKLITTGTALNILGPEYRFETKFYKRGNIKNNELIGDLVIDTNYDFTFGSKKMEINYFENLRNELLKIGINKIRGKILLKKNNNFNVPLSWSISDVGNYYGAFPGYFNFNENIFNVYFNGGNKIGEPAILSAITPKYPKWRFINKVKTAAADTGDEVNIVNLPFSNDIILVGTVPLGAKMFEVKGSSPAIEEVFKELLISDFQKNNIFVFNQTNFSDYLRLDSLIYIQKSKPLKEIITQCNFKSINFFADGLSNYLISKDSTLNYESFLNEYWLKQNLDFSNFKINDGSGLSASNYISTNKMTEFLSKMYVNNNFNVFLNSIPVVGKTGTVARLDPKNVSKGKIWAKSGSIANTRNYAGYFLNKNEEIHTFAVYFNGFNDKNSLQAKALIEKIMLKMIEL